MEKTLIRGGTLVGADGLKKSDILISVTGEIENIAPEIKDHKNAKVIDATGKLLFPLLIDCHVHFREPGLEHKATLASEAASALAGGVGTVCEMPNTVPATVTIAALADKVRRAEDVNGCTIKFFFGVTEAAHLQTLKELWTGESYELKRLKNHCCGVKLYLDHSTGDQKVDGGILSDVFKTCAELKIPIVAHCEDPEMNNASRLQLQASSSSNISLHSKFRPPESEAKSISDAIELVRKTGAALHIAHLSTAQGIDLVRKAKKEKLPVTCEVAPHHLFLTTEDYGKLGALGKMNPPLRDPEHQKALWEGIADKTVDCIATDHAPHTLDEKNVKNPLEAPSGVPGVETMLPLLLNACAKKNLRYEDIVRLCFENPNRIFSLKASGIAVKNPARFSIVDPSASWTIEGKKLHAKCGWTPYEGWLVQGKIETIYK